MNQNIIHKSLSDPLKFQFYKTLILLSVTTSFLMLLSAGGDADTTQVSVRKKIFWERVSSQANGGYGYKPQYYDPAPIDAF